MNGKHSTRVPQLVDLSSPRLRVIGVLCAATFALMLFFGVYFSVVTAQQNHILANQSAGQARQEAILNRLEHTDALIRNVIHQSQDPKVQAEQKALAADIIKIERDVEKLLARKPGNERTHSSQ